MLSAKTAPGGNACLSRLCANQKLKFLSAFFGIAFAAPTFVSKAIFPKFPTMTGRSYALTLALTSICFSAFTQKLKKADRLTLANLQSEIQWLADDKLEGRRTGTPGEKMAADYIIAAFQKINLQPKGENSGWTQPFDVYDGRKIDSNTSFKVNGKELSLQKDFFPLAFSASKKVNGSPAVALQESGDPWFVDLKDVLEANQGNPHFSLEDDLMSRVKNYRKKGATAILFYNSSKLEDNIAFQPKDKAAPLEIPVIYLTRDGKRKWFRDEAASQDISISVSLSEVHRTGNNLIGLIDNKANRTIIIGAHYDHLGYGEDGSSLYRGPEKMIHNGADDNASGTAAMIELARILKQSKLKKSNYLFIAFSGEELGLFGSKYFTEHPTIDLAGVDYMVNMDMVGRLNDSTHALTIGGYGTSPEWGILFSDLKDSKYFNLKFDSSGTGPSDYTSFYRKDIPVLFFFTGIHSDYHKPSDDADKINYTGEVMVIKLIYNVIEDLNDKGKLAFTKTRETQSMGTARFSVTLGIMPDYTFNGTGVRVDGISEGRPAQKAGLKAGDIIVKLGDYSISSLDTYMQALSKFKKGDKTTVDYKRGNDAAQAQVEF